MPETANDNIPDDLPRPTPRAICVICARYPIFIADWLGEKVLMYLECVHGKHEGFTADEILDAWNRLGSHIDA